MNAKTKQKGDEQTLEAEARELEEGEIEDNEGVDESISTGTIQSNPNKSYGNRKPQFVNQKNERKSWRKTESKSIFSFYGCVYVFKI